MNDLQIGIFTHIQYRNHKPVHGPSDTLLDYLKDTIPGQFFYLQHSIGRGDGSELQIFKDGQMQRTKKEGKFKNFPDPLRYFVELDRTLRWLIPENYFKLIIAVDPLNFFYAYFLKKIKKADKLIYYTVDYAYRRFKNPVLNKIYFWMDLFAVKRADMLWSSCKKIQEVRRQQKVDNGKNIYISNCPIFKDRDLISLGEKDQFSLVNIFSNYNQVDFNIMFDALSRLIEYFPQISLKLIGRGNFINEVIPIIKDKRLMNYIKFMDISSHEQALQEVSRSAIGLECNKQIDSWNEFREPLKIMEYITFGLPVVSKPGHAMAGEIMREKMGFIVINSDEMFKAIDSLFSNPGLYSEFKQNTQAFVKRNDKEEIIRRSLAHLGLNLQ